MMRWRPVSTGRLLLKTPARDGTRASGRYRPAAFFKKHRRATKRAPVAGIDRPPSSKNTGARQRPVDTGHLFRKTPARGETRANGRSIPAAFFEKHRRAAKRAPAPRDERS
jgi:hypothetical protein